MRWVATRASTSSRLDRLGDVVRPRRASAPTPCPPRRRAPTGRSRRCRACRVAPSAARHTSKPSMSGIITSSSIRSGCARVAMSSAARPSFAARMRCPLPLQRAHQHLQVHRAVVDDEDRGGGRQAQAGVRGSVTTPVELLSPASAPGQRRAARRSRTARPSRAMRRPSAASPASPATSSCASASRSVIAADAPPPRAAARASRMARRRARHVGIGRRFGRAGAETNSHAEVRLQRREQRLGAHRLRQVVDAAGVARRLARVAERAGGDGNHRDVRRSPGPPPAAASPRTRRGRPSAGP